MAKTILALSLLLSLMLITGCGGSAKNSAPPIDPSGNWAMKFTDPSSNTMVMSALFNQVGSTVSGQPNVGVDGNSISAAGNPAPFSCVPFVGNFANGTVQNVDQFSGDILTPFGNIHFTSTLNPAGTHAAGTYTISGGNTCWTVAASGTFSADEIPSMTGTWTGTVACGTACAAGVSGSITMTLTQNDSTGVVSGTYATSGVPGMTNGTVATIAGADILSGTSWVANMDDSNGKTFGISGGPTNGPGSSAGLGLNRSFNGNIGVNQIDEYTVTMSH